MTDRLEQILNSIEDGMARRVAEKVYDNRYHGQPVKASWYTPPWQHSRDDRVRALIRSGVDAGEARNVWQHRALRG